ncbi:hypothetical protein F4821DRAFT_223617 [Hypoxylon rubiginosum]|uniref:Uncharacterized protein n=1 Tax=Hypoxylon rubiginosum TaxID=110542 RepID=A0ACC0DJK6_9PEZI|nr:hypothetical protein F4821DRAFT_223617 [Hypoxylon rubiginosum]
MENQPLTFFSLPVEIRLEIYKLVLKKHVPIQFSTSPQFGRQFNSSERQNPFFTAVTAREFLTTPQLPCHTALLLTCRQINAEATPVLVAVNMIVFEIFYFSFFVNLQWLDTIRPIFRHLKRLTLWIDKSGESPVMQILAYSIKTAAQQRRAPLLNRMTILFQTDAWIDLQRPSRANEWADFWAALPQSLLEFLHTVPDTVDVGYYPTVQHAFEDMSNDHRYEYR